MGDLYNAAREGDLEAVRRLLDRGTGINEAPTMGHPLFIASMYGYKEVCKLLLERGANVDQAKDGETPLTSREGYATSQAAARSRGQRQPG